MHEEHEPRHGRADASFVLALAHPSVLVGRRFAGMLDQRSQGADETDGHGIRARDVICRCVVQKVGNDMSTSKKIKTILKDFL